MGGIVRWSILKKEIENYLKESDVYVTMLIDYYGLYSKYNFPGWDESLKKIDKNERMDSLEAAMQNNVSATLRHRFIPYMQLHEFEGLLFNNIEVFYEQVPKNELVGIAELEKTFRDYPENPEMINNIPELRVKAFAAGEAVLKRFNIFINFL